MSRKKSISITFGKSRRAQASAWNGMRALAKMEPLPICAKCAGIAVDDGPKNGRCICAKIEDTVEGTNEPK